MVEIQQKINTPLKLVYIVGNEGTTLNWKAEGFVQETYRKQELESVVLDL